MKVSVSEAAGQLEARGVLKREAQDHSERVIEHAVFGMLPKNSLTKQKLRTKLKVYAGAQHPHAAQQPVPYSVSPKAK